MRFSWGAIYALLYVYRSVFSGLGEAVIVKLTPIPDTHGYQSFNIMNVMSLSETYAYDGGLMMRGIATTITYAVAGLFNALGGGNPVLINMGFQTIAFVGIVLLLRSVDSRTRKMLLAGKEALVVFLVCVVAKYVIDIYNNRERFGLLELASLVALYMFKPHFMPAVLFVIVVSKFAGRVRQPAMLALAAGAASLWLLYLARGVVNNLALFFANWIYEGTGGSSRTERLLVEQYDVFTNAPRGMWMSFVGPTWNEATTNALHMAVYLESMTILALLASYVLLRLPGTPAYSFIVGMFTLFWILFATYPLGLSNPGTAIRFRTDYILIIYMAVVVLTSRTMYVRWLRQRLPLRGRVAPPERARVPVPRTRG